MIIWTLWHECFLYSCIKELGKASHIKKVDSYTLENKQFQIFKALWTNVQSKKIFFPNLYNRLLFVLKAPKFIGKWIELLNLSLKKQMLNKSKIKVKQSVYL